MSNAATSVRILTMPRNRDRRTILPHRSRPVGQTGGNIPRTSPPCGSPARQSLSNPYRHQNAYRLWTIGREPVSVADPE